MKEAVTEFATATRLQPEALPPYVNASLAYNALGQNDKAEASLRCALRLDPTNAPANLNLGMLMAEMGNLPAAEQALRTAFQSNPRSAQTAYNLGVLLAKEQPAEALEWCRRAAALGPDNPKYGYTYAFYLYRAGQPEQALKTIRSVRERHPTHEDSALFEQALLKEQKATGPQSPLKN
jgi:tetratricopeptide (TPR) repeat protein